MWNFGSAAPLLINQKYLGEKSLGKERGGYYA